LEARMRDRLKPDGTYYECGVEALLDVIGGKWKTLIVFHLIDGTRRFGELRRLLPGVTQRMLTLHLRELEADGIVHREVYREVPPRVEYALTDFGATLTPVLLVMRQWGEEYRSRVETIKQNAREERRETA